jgi:hypothetical protein
MCQDCTQPEGSQKNQDVSNMPPTRTHPTRYRHIPYLSNLALWRFDPYSST